MSSWAISATTGCLLEPFWVQNWSMLAGCGIDLHIKTWKQVFHMHYCSFCTDVSLWGLAENVLWQKTFQTKKILPSLWCNMVVCLAQPRLHWPSYRLTMFVFSLRPFFLHLYQHILFIGFFTAAVQLSTVCSMLHRPVPTTSTAMSLPSSPTAGFTITRGSVLEL